MPVPNSVGTVRITLSQYSRHVERKEVSAENLSRFSFVGTSFIGFLTSPDLPPQNSPPGSANSGFPKSNTG
jgi:hypothetical protein